MFQKFVKFSKIIWQKKGPLVAKSTLKRRAKKRPAVPNSKTHYKYMTINIGTNQPMEQSRELKDGLMYMIKGVPQIDGGKIL